MRSAPPTDPRSPHDQALAALRAIPWLMKAQPGTLELMARSAHLESHAGGTQVGWRGRIATHFMVVVRGTLLVGFDMPDGRRHVINLVGPGQFQSLIPLIDERPQIHDTHCREDAALLLIPRDAFVSALQGDPSLSWEILRLLCVRSRRLYESLGESHTLALAPRLARILRGLFAEHGAQLGIDQEELADILGATRQRINRELKILEKTGASALGRGKISLIQAERLRESCGVAV
jgi:CRP/FNR family cyclic AMP-dependent transcriptional regulator